jgi:hypothetical protein
VHQVKAVAFDVDRARGESGPVAVKVDCTAPTASVAIDGSSERVAGETLVPMVAAGDVTSGLAGTTLQVSVDGGPWTAVGGPVVVAAERSYRFRVRAEDLAGNVSGWGYSAVVTGVAAPSPVAAPPTMKVPGQGDAAEKPVSPAVPEAGRGSAPAGDVRGGGGTVAPGPVLRTGGAALTGTGGPAGETRTTTRKAAPALRITRVKTRGRRLTLTGSTARGFAGRVVVEVALATAGGKDRVVRKTARVRDGRWSVSVTLPRATSVRAKRATARTAETATHAASAVSVRLG